MKEIGYENEPAGVSSNEPVEHLLTLTLQLPMRDLILYGRKTVTGSRKDFKYKFIEQVIICLVFDSFYQPH